MKSNMILVGLPSCGKTTLGRQAAEIFGMDFVDTDEMILAGLKKENLSPAKIFTLAMQRGFCRVQHEVIENLRAIQKPAIISTGAEASLSQEHVQVLREIGVIVHILRDPDIVMNCMRNRPARERGLQLVNMDTGKKTMLDESCLESYLDCAPWYRDIADIIIENNGDISEGLDALVKAIRAYRSGALVQ
ncbi:MAG: hypothetical protein LBF61_00155 [Azoarcus sp.]|nr:hypothetical protein [Azoarcus sp.]